jgi:hypothetical protein
LIPTSSVSAPDDVKNVKMQFASFPGAQRDNAAVSEFNLRVVVRVIAQSGQSNPRCLTVPHAYSPKRPELSATGPPLLGPFRQVRRCGQVGLTALIYRLDLD